MTGEARRRTAMLFLRFDAVNDGLTKILATLYSCGGIGSTEVDASHSPNNNVLNSNKVDFLITFSNIV